MNNLPNTANNQVSVDEIIKRAKDRGFYFGFGDPYNRIRYYIKIGLLPKMSRLSTGDGKSAGHLPLTVVDSLLRIQELDEQGLTKDQIKQRLIESSRIATIAKEIPVSQIEKVDSLQPACVPEVTVEQAPIKPTSSHKFLILTSAALALVIFLGLVTINLGVTTKNAIQKASVKSAQTANLQNVLAASAKSLILNIDAPAQFAKSATIGGTLDVVGNLTAPNVVYRLIAGNGIAIGAGQTPTVTNTGVLSFQGSTGAVTLTGSNGVSVSGTGISLSGVPNSALSNSKITINTTGSLSGGGSVELGGSLTLTATVSAAGPSATTSAGVIPIMNSTGDFGNSVLSQDGTNLFISGVQGATVASAACVTSSNGIVTGSGPCAGLGVSGTLNRIVKFTTTSDVGDSMFQDNGYALSNPTNGGILGVAGSLPIADFVAIAASNSAYPTLTLRGDSTSSTASISGTNANATLIVDNNAVGDVFTASTSGLTRFVIDRNGNVGIGSSVPGYSLDVNGTVNATAYRIGGVAGATVASASCVTTSGGIVTGSGNCPAGSPGDKWQLNNGILTPSETTQSLSLGASSTASAKLYFDAVNGNALIRGGASIASTSGSASLTVNQSGTGDIFTASASGVAKFTISNTGALTSAAYTTNGGLLFANSSGVISQTGAGTTTTVLHGGTSPSYSAVVLGTDTSGNFVQNVANGAGITGGSAGSVNASLTLAVDQSFSPVWTGRHYFTNGVNIASNSGNTAALTITQNGAGDIFTASQNGTPKFTIANSGNVGIGSTVPGYTLDVNGTINGTAYRVGGVAGASVTASCVTTSGGIVTSAASCPTGTGATLFQLNSGVISPVELSQSLALGATSTASATIFLNGVNGNIQTLGGAYIASTSGSAALTVNQSGTGDIFTSSASGVAKFTISNTGALTSAAYTTNGGLLFANGSGAISQTGAGTTTTVLHGGTSPSYSAVVLGTDTSGNFVQNVANGAGITGGSAGSVNASLTLAVDQAFSPVWTGRHYFTNGVNIASNSGSTAALIVNQNGAGDIFTASQNGTPKFTIANSGNVGIGSTTPGYALDVNGTINGTAYRVGGAAGATVTAACVNATGGIVTGSAACPTGTGATLFQLNSGVISPVELSQSLALGATSTASAKLYFDGINGNALITGGANISSVSGTAALIANQSGTGDILSASTAGVTKFVITNAGNVGIGSSVPSQKLDVLGAVRLGANGSANDVLNTTVGGGAPSGYLYWGSRTLCDTSGNCIGGGAGGVGGSGTTNYVARFTDANHIGTGLLYDNGNGIGINTTTPLASLDVQFSTTSAIASISGKAALAGLIVDNSGTGDLFTASSSGLSRFVITQNGNVGIGSTAPGYKLDVVGTASVSGTLGVGGNVTLNGVAGDPTVTSALFLNGSNIVTSRTLGSAAFTSTGAYEVPLTFGNGLTRSVNAISLGGALTGATTISGNGGALLLNNSGILPMASVSAQSSFAGLLVDNTIGDLFTASSSGLSRFVITQNGNVGIGTTAPGSMLEVDGSTRLNSTLYVSGNVISQITMANDIVPDSDDSRNNGNSVNAWSYIYTHVIDSKANTNLTLNDNNAANYVLISPNGGNVGIGSVTPGYALDVNGTIKATAYRVGATPGATVSTASCVTSDGGIVTGSGSCPVGTGASLWQLSSGLINPVESTQSLALGATSTASAKLYFDGVNGNALINGGASIASTSGSASLTVNQSGTGDIFTASKSGVSKFVIDTNGYVGIGTTTPASLLSVANTGYTANIGENLNIGFTGMDGSVNKIGKQITTTFAGSTTAGGGNHSALQIDASNNLSITSNPSVRGITVNVDNAGSIGGNMAGVIVTTTRSQSAGNGSNIGGNFTATTNQSSGNLSVNYGVAGNAYSSNTGGTISDNHGGDFIARVNGSGSTVTNNYGVYALAQSITAASTITNNYGVISTVHSGVASTISSMAAYNGSVVISNGTISNLYGLYIPAMTKSGGTVTTAYGAYLDTPTAGTTNYPLYVAGSGNSYFAGNLGIGITSPTASLQVASTGNTQTASVSATSGKSALLVDNTVGDLFTASSSGLSRFVITQSGNVGIGVTNPSSFALQVAGNIGPNADNTYDLGSSPSARFRNLFLGPGSAHIICRTGDGCDQNLDYELGILSSGTGKNNFIIGLNGNSSARNAILSISQSGYVGIGTAAPTAALDITGSIKASGTFTSGAGVGATVSTAGCVTSVGGIVTGTSGCPTSGQWQLNSGVISPVEITQSLAIGATSTASAKVYFSGVDGSSTQTFSGTTTNGSVLTGNGLTTGNLLSLTSTSISQTTGKMLSVDFSPAGGTNYSGNLVNINVGSMATISGQIFAIQDNGSNIFSVNQTQLVSAIPVSVTAAGDTSFAYDINFTNPSVSMIKSLAPLYIAAGDYPNSSDLTLRTYNKGNIVFDANEATVFNKSATISGQLAVNTVGSTSLGIGFLPAATISAQTSVAAMIIDNRGGDVFTASTSGLSRFTVDKNGNVIINSLATAATNKVLYVDATGQITGVNNSGADACLHQATNGVPSWGSCSGAGITQWQLNSGVVTPFDTTQSVSLGSTATASAKLLLDGVTGFISNNSTTGLNNIPGSVSINDNLSIAATSSAYPAVRINATTGQAAMIINQADTGGDLFTASAAASPKFVIDKSGGVTINALGTAATYKVLYVDANGTIAGSNNSGADACLHQASNGAPSWGSCGSGSTPSQWQLNSGVVTPADVTQSLSLGATSTASAKVYFNAVNGSSTQTFSGTTTNGSVLTGNGLTTGNLLGLTSTSISQTTGKLLNIDFSPGGATLYTGNLVNINVGSMATISGQIFNIQDNGSNIFSVNQSAIVANLPASFNAAGDVAVAYDINFTNPVSSYIKSAAPMYIQSGDIFNSSDLTLRTFNKGNIIFDANEATVFNKSATISGQLSVLTTQTATGAAFISNATTNAASDGLIIKMGATTQDATTHWIRLLDLNGKTVGTARGNTGLTTTWLGNGIDFGEYFKADPAYVGSNKNIKFPEGTVVCTGANGVTPCSATESAKIVGAVSFRSSFVGGLDEPNEAANVQVGLLGQVPVRMATNSASVKVGDPLTISDNGAAKKLSGRGYFVARALADWDNTKGSTVMSYINPGYSEGDDLYLASKKSVDQIQDEVASISANLSNLTNSANLSTMSAQFGTFSESLKSIGTTQLGNTTIGGTLNVGLVNINDLTADINSMTGTLSLQNGRVTIGEIGGIGEIGVDGNLTITKTLTAKSVESEGFKVLGSKSAGSATLLSGQTSVTISSANVGPTSRVLITPTTLTSKVLVVTNKSNGNFTVSVASSDIQNIQFDWFVVEN